MTISKDSACCDSGAKLKCIYRLKLTTNNGGATVRRHGGVPARGQGRHGPNQPRSSQRCIMANHDLHELSIEGY